MQGAALGLTCKDAFQVFSQNETLALQAQVKQLKARLAYYSPPITRPQDKIEPEPLRDMVRAVFDKKYPPDSRPAPVTTEDVGVYPLYWRSIWSSDILNDRAQNSLQAVIMQVLKNALGDMSANYCRKQSHKAIKAVQHALYDAYEKHGWITFSEQQMQEDTVWQAIGQHFFEMQEDLEDWDHLPCWF